MLYPATETCPQSKKFARRMPGETNATLVVTNMQPTNAGTYTVVMSNSVSWVTAQAVVSYGVPISILTAPQNQVAEPGTNVTLGVTVTGTGPITYDWQFDGTNMPSETNATLVITNMQASDAGTYTVTVSDSVSVVTCHARSIGRGSVRTIG